MNVTLNILDCNLQRKLKPIQNLSLIFFTISWAFIFLLIFFNNSWANLIFNLLIYLSIISIVITLISSLLFLKKKRIGTFQINLEEVNLENKETFKIQDCYLDLNIDSFEKMATPSKEQIEKLPFWGNFIVHEKDNTKIEFEPNEEFEKLVPILRINNSKRPALSMNTADLFKNVMNLLWAAS